MAPESRNILVITLSNIGDVILTTPVIASLHASFPQAKLTVVTGPKAAPLLKGSRQIDRLLIYDKGAGFARQWELIRSLNEISYDEAVDLRNTALPFLVRARRRSPLFRWNESRNARRQHLEVLGRTGLPVEESAKFDFFSPEDQASLSEKLAKRGFDLEAGIVVAPGAGSDEKRWRLEGFGEVASRLLERTDLRVFAVGDASETSLGRLLSEIDPKRVLNLCGEITLRELASLVSRARLVLTNDSAVMHLGYELFRPVVAVFGPTDHRRYGRENKIWRIVRETPPFNLQDLSPEKVFRACEELLHGKVYVG